MSTEQQIARTENDRAKIVLRQVTRVFDIKNSKKSEEQFVALGGINFEVNES